MQEFPAVVTADKSISHFPGWSKPEPETNYVWFDAPLEIGGVTEAGLFLHCGAMVDFPDQNVTFELVARNTRGRRQIPLCRICWRSLKGGHSNLRRGRPDGIPPRVPDTHIHEFQLNWSSEKGRMIGKNLPFAADIKEQLSTFEEAREFCGNAFRINNIDVVELPKWEYNLFYGASS